MSFILHLFLCDGLMVRYYKVMGVMSFIQRLELGLVPQTLVKIQKIQESLCNSLSHHSISSFTNNLHYVVEVFLTSPIYYLTFNYHISQNIEQAEHIWRISDFRSRGRQKFTLLPSEFVPTLEFCVVLKKRKLLLAVGTLELVCSTISEFITDSWK